MSAALARLPKHSPVSRHAGNPQWAAIEAVTRAVMEAQAAVFGFSSADVDWLTRKAADSYFDMQEAERYRALGAVDCGRTVQ